MNLRSQLISNILLDGGLLGSAATTTSDARADLQRFMHVAFKSYGIRTLVNLREDETVELERVIAERMGRTSTNRGATSKL